jgi:hypothetical protein
VTYLDVGDTVASRDGNGSTWFFNVTSDSQVVTNVIAPNPFATGTGNPGYVTIEPNPNPVQASLLYMVSGQYFGSYDVMTGVFTYIGDMILTVIDDIAICPDGIMYAISADNQALYKVNLQNATLTQVGDFFSETNVRSLTCSYAGDLYVTRNTVLYSINTTDITFSIVCNGITVDGQSANGDIIFIGANIFLLTDFGTLYKINVADCSASSPIGYLDHAMTQYGLAETYYNGSVHVWSGYSINLQETNIYSGFQGFPVIPNTTLFNTINGMTAYCWTNLTDLVQVVGGNINMLDNEVHNVNLLTIDNMQSTNRYQNDAIVVHSTLKFIPFGVFGVTPRSTVVALDVDASVVVCIDAYGLRVAAPTGGNTTNNAINLVTSGPDGGITYGSDPSPNAANFYRTDVGVLKSDGNIVSNSHINLLELNTKNNTQIKVLTKFSPQQQYFSGALSQNITLPDTSTLVLGQNFRIINKSGAGNLLIETFTGFSIYTLTNNTWTYVTCISTSSNLITSWSIELGSSVN